VARKMLVLVFLLENGLGIKAGNIDYFHV